MPADSKLPIGRDIRACPTCGAARIGPYCVACGERFARPADFDLFLLSHLWREFFEIDGKVLHTLGQFLRHPGMCALEFINGRRKPYLSPLRLYLVLFLIQAALTTLLVGNGQSLPQLVDALDSTGVPHHLIALRPDVNWNGLELRVRLTERTHWFYEVANLLVFLGVAAIQALVFWRLRRRFVEHLRLTLNVTSFMLFVVLCADLVIAVTSRARFTTLSESVQQMLALLALPVYWWLAIRRFYGIGRGVAMAAVIVMTAVHALTATLFNTLMRALLIVTA